MTQKFFLYKSAQGLAWGKTKDAAKSRRKGAIAAHKIQQEKRCPKCDNIGTVPDTSTCPAKLVKCDCKPD